METVDIWQIRFEAVDRIISQSKNAWAVNYWTGVRKRLLRNMNLELSQRYR
jgi:hypothetical protein